MSNNLSYLKSLFSRAPTEARVRILNLLNDTKDLRSSVFLDFMNANDKIFYQAKARCIHFDEKIVRFCFNSGIENLPIQAVKVACFFILQKGKKKIPHSYISTVVDVEQKNASVSIDVAIPTEITHTQRRGNLRIPITKEDILTLRLWAEKERENTENNDSENDNTDNNNNTDNNSNNRVTWEPIDQEDFELINISAGGLRINIAKSSLISPRLRKNFLFMCTGSFDIPQKPATELAIIAVVRRVGIPDKGRWNSVALRFYRWAKIADGKATWTDIHEKDSGIPILGAWLVPIIAQLNKKAN